MTDALSDAHVGALKLCTALKQHLNQALENALLDVRFRPIIAHGKRIAVNAIGDLLVTFGAFVLSRDARELLSLVKQIAHVWLTLCEFAPPRDPSQLAAVLAEIDELRAQVVALGAAGASTSEKLQ